MEHGRTDILVRLSLGRIKMLFRVQSLASIQKCDKLVVYDGNVTTEETVAWSYSYSFIQYSKNPPMWI
jgi:hypothetical protein